MLVPFLASTSHTPILSPWCSPSHPLQAGASTTASSGRSSATVDQFRQSDQPMLTVSAGPVPGWPILAAGTGGCPLQGAEDDRQAHEDQRQRNHRQAAEVEADQKPESASELTYLGGAQCRRILGDRALTGHWGSRPGPPPDAAQAERCPPGHEHSNRQDHDP